MLLVWDKIVFEKIDCDVGLYFVNVLLKGVADDFVWLVQECMGLMKIVSGVLCGKNSQECTPDGMCLGVLLGDFYLPIPK